MGRYFFGRGQRGQGGLFGRGDGTFGRRGRGCGFGGTCGPNGDDDGYGGRGPSAWSAARPGMPYRARDGMIMGVCKGLARHWGVSVFLVRAVAVLLLLFTGLWPMVGFYLLAGFLMKPEPAVAPETEDAAEFYDAYAGSRAQALARLKRKFDGVERRIRRMEDRVTSREFQWERRMNDDG